jgi:pilus assembly protein CpaE
VQKEAQKALNRKLEYWLPHDPQAARASADRGQPLSTVAPRSQLGKAISRLARDTIETFPVTHIPPTRGR